MRRVCSDPRRRPRSEGSMCRLLSHRLISRSRDSAPQPAEGRTSWLELTSRWVREARRERQSGRA